MSPEEKLRLTHIAEAAALIAHYIEGIADYPDPDLIRNLILLGRPRFLHGSSCEIALTKLPISGLGQQSSYVAQLLPRKALTGKVTSGRASTFTASSAVASSFAWY